MQHTLHRLGAISLFLILLCTTAAKAQTPPGKSISGQVVVHFTDGSQRQGTMATMSNSYVTLRQDGGSHRYNTQMIDHVEVTNLRGELLYFEQGRVRGFIMGMIPIKQQKWLQRTSISHDLELFEQAKFKALSATKKRPRQQKNHYYLRKAGGPIVPIRPDAVLEAVKDDPHALAIAQKGKNKYYSSHVSRILGVAVVAGSIAFATNDRNPASRDQSVMIVGIAGFLCLLNGDFQMAAGECYLLEALKKYKAPTQ